MPFKFLFLFVIIAIIGSCESQESAQKSSSNHSKPTTPQYKWHEATEPTGNQTRVYGGYTAGCIDGAVKLPEKGVGYIAANYNNNRLYGHPKLIKLIEETSITMKEKYGKTILIGDLGQARGGPAPLKTSAHRSHQNGLDVDIWYRNINKDNITEEDVYPQTVLSFFKNKLSNKHWNESHVELLKYVAQQNDVERILLNPHVKKAMCSQYSNEKWIHKLRPWWGHHKHFHVRLKCPKNDITCKKQDPVPNEDSCGEPLNWWFSKEAEDMGKNKKATKRRYPDLPQQCEQVWNFSQKHLSYK